MEEAIKKPALRQSSGRANEVNYWIFDYKPEEELIVRERIKYLQNKNAKGTDDFQFVVFDLSMILQGYFEVKTVFILWGDGYDGRAENDLYKRTGK